MSQTYEQLHNLDNYGYPLPPGSQRRLRKTAIRASKNILLRCIYLLLSIIGGLLWLGGLGKKYPPLTPQNAHPRRILVIRLDLIADLVLSTTVVRALQRPYANPHIDLPPFPTRPSLFIP